MCFSDLQSCVDCSWVGGFADEVQLGPAHAHAHWFLTAQSVGGIGREGFKVMATPPSDVAVGESPSRRCGGDARLGERGRLHRHIARTLTRRHERQQVRRATAKTHRTLGIASWAASASRRRLTAHVNQTCVLTVAHAEVSSRPAVEDAATIRGPSEQAPAKGGRWQTL